MKGWLKHFGLCALICLMAGAVLAAAPNAAAADREVIKLRVVAGHPYAEGTFWVKSLEDFFCREVEKRVLERTDKYEVQFKGYYGGTVAKLGEVFESVQNGMADIGLVTTVFEMAKLEPINFTFWVPFNTENVEMTLKAYIDTINTFPVFDEMLAKYKQVRLGDMYWPQTSYQLITTFPIRKLEDLKGKKLGHGGPHAALAGGAGRHQCPGHVQ